MTMAQPNAVTGLSQALGLSSYCQFELEDLDGFEDEGGRHAIRRFHSPVLQHINMKVILAQRPCPSLNHSSTTV